MHLDVLQRGQSMPAYCRAADSLSSEQREALATHTLRLPHRLLPDDARYPPIVTTFHQARSVTWVKLVRGQWLLAACSDNATSTLSLWSIASLRDTPGTALPLAQAYLEGPVAAGLIDIQEDNTLLVALELRAESFTSVEILSLLFTNDSLVFVRLQTIYDEISHIRCLRGSKVAFALHLGLSVPSVLNWKTGEVIRLHSVPNVDGGAVAIDIEDDLVAVVTPRELQVWTLSHTNNKMSPELCRSIPLGCSVGQADCTFDQSLPGRGSRALFIAITGEDGLFVYSIPKDQLRSGTLTDDLSLIARIRNVPPWDMASKRRLDRPYSPAFGAHCSSLSWLVACAEDLPEGRRHVRFATMSINTPGVADANAAGDSTPGPMEYQLEHTEMPAMYAAGVYDYDDGLGLAAFGNAFGELALFDLCGSNSSMLAGCFEPLSTSPGHTSYSIMPEFVAPSTCFPPFPYAGPEVPSDSLKQQMLALWRPQQPSQIPAGWVREADPGAEDPRAFSLDWFYYVPRMPIELDDIAWALEHAHHFYGQPVPLVANDWARIFSAGGLLFLWVIDDTVRVAPPGTSFEDLAALNAGGSVAPTLRRTMDNSAFYIGARFWDFWLWECEYRGRNRWQELKDRGGAVHADRLNNAPKPKISSV